MLSLVLSFAPKERTNWGFRGYPPISFLCFFLRRKNNTFCSFSKRRLIPNYNWNSVCSINLSPLTRIRPLTLNRKYPLHFMLYKRTFFDLKDCGTLNTFQGVPHILGNVNAIAAFFMTEYDAIYYRTIIIIC